MAIPVSDYTFQPLNIAQTLATGENLRGARNQNALLALELQREQDPNSNVNQARDLALRQQQAGAQSAELQAALPKLQATQQALDAVQATIESRGAAAGRQRFNERISFLKSNGMLPDSYEAPGADLSDEEFAADIAQSREEVSGLLQSLAAPQQGTRVQSSFTTEDGRLGYLTSAGEPVVTDVRVAGPSIRPDWIDLPDGRRVWGRLDPATGAVFGPTGELLFQPVRGAGAQGGAGQPAAAPETGPGVARSPEETAAATARATAQAEEEISAPKRAAALQSTFLKVDNALDSIDRSAGMANPFSTGAIGQLTGWLGSTPAYRLNNELQTVKAALTFDTLQEMRANSPTGGALGQTSNTEIGLLGSAVASLDPAVGPDALIDALRRVQAHYENWKLMALYDGPAPTSTDWKPEGYLYYDEDGKKFYRFLGGDTNEQDNWQEVE